MKTPSAVLIGWLCVQGSLLGFTPQTFAAEKNPAENQDAASWEKRADEKLQSAHTREDFITAAQFLERAEKLDRKNETVRQKLGWIYLEKLHDPMTAHAHLAAAIRLNPNDVDARKLMGMDCTQLGYTHRAVHHFREAARLKPDDLWIKANLGRALARIGKYHEANQLFDEVLASDGKNIDARLGRAEVAAWRGRSGKSLEIVSGVLAQSPTNVEALTLRGDVHRWDWDLSEARQDYEQVLSLSPNDYQAENGLIENERMGWSDISVKGYQFKDRTDFQREYLQASTRIHLVDKVYLTARGAGWRFENPGFDEVDRIDGYGGLEVHWARWLETTVEGGVYKYEHRGAVASGQASLKLSPMQGYDIYGVGSLHQPFISSIATVTNGLRQDTAGAGADFKLFWRFSVQNTFQYAKISDDNKWWEEKPQLSFHLLNKPSVFVRAEYDYLTYSDFNTNYFSPKRYQTFGPVGDVSIPIGKWIHINVTAKAPYVFDASKWGYQVEGGPTIDFSSRFQIQGSYIYASYPGVENGPTGSTRPPWAGHGWQASLKLRF